MSESSELQHSIFTKDMPNGDVYFYDRQLDIDPLSGLQKSTQLKLLAVQKYGSDDVISMCPLQGAPKGCKVQVIVAPNKQILALVPYAFATEGSLSVYEQAAVQAQQDANLYHQAQAQADYNAAHTNPINQVNTDLALPNYGRTNDELRFAPYAWSYYHQGQEVPFVPREINVADGAHEDSQAIFGDDGTSVPDFLNVTASISNSVLTSKEKQTLLPKSKSLDRAWLPHHRIRAFGQEQETPLEQLKAQAQSSAQRSQELATSQLYPNTISARPEAQVNPIYAGLRATTAALAAHNDPLRSSISSEAASSAASLSNSANDLSSIYELPIGMAQSVADAPYNSYTQLSSVHYPMARQQHMQALSANQARPSVSAANTPLTANLGELPSATDNSRLQYVKTPQSREISSFKDFSTPQDNNSSAFISAKRYITAPQKAVVTPRSSLEQQRYPALGSLEWQMKAMQPAAPAAKAMQPAAADLSAAHLQSEPNADLMEDSTDNLVDNNLSDEAYSENTLITSVVNGTYQQQTIHHNPVLTSSERDERNTITTHHVSTDEGSKAAHSNYHTQQEPSEHSEHNAAAALRAAGAAEHHNEPTVSKNAGNSTAQDSSKDTTTNSGSSKTDASTQSAETKLTPSAATAITASHGNSAAQRALQPQSANINVSATPMRTRHVIISDGSRTQTQAQALSLAPDPSLRRSSLGNKPAPVSAQTRAQAQAYIASLQAHANKAVLAVKAAQKIAQATFGDTYEIPPYQMPTADASRLEHLSMPNVNIPLYEDPNYIPSDSAIAFADQHAPYHQAFSHSTSISRYSYGAEFASQEEKEVRSAKEYQQRVHRLAQEQAAYAAEAKAQGSVEESWEDFIPASNTNYNEPRTRITHHDYNPLHHVESSIFAPNNAANSTGAQENNAPNTAARPYTPMATPWWRDQAITEQTAQEAFAEDKFHQSRQGAFIGTPEEFLPEEQAEELNPTNNFLNQSQFSPRTVVSAATSESTIVSAPSFTQQDRNAQAFAQAQILAQQQSHNAAAHYTASAEQYISPYGNDEALELDSYEEALREENREAADLIAEHNAFAKDSMVLSTPSTVVSGKGSQAAAAAAASEAPIPEPQVAPETTESPEDFRPSGNTAVERRPLHTYRIDRTFSDFITANGKKGTEEAVAAAAAAAARKGEFDLDPTSPAADEIAPAVALQSSNATAISSTSKDLAAAYAAYDAAPAALESDVPQHPTAIAITPQQKPKSPESDSSDNTAPDFSDFKTADGSTVASDYKIRVISQKQLKAQRASEEAQAKLAAEQAEQERRQAEKEQTAKLFTALQKAAQLEVMAAHNAAEQARELARVRAEVAELTAPAAEDLPESDVVATSEVESTGTEQTKAAAAIPADRQNKLSESQDSTDTSVTDDMISDDQASGPVALEATENTAASEEIAPAADNAVETADLATTSESVESAEHLEPVAEPAVESEQEASADNAVEDTAEAQVGVAEAPAQVSAEPATVAVEQDTTATEETVATESAAESSETEQTVLDSEPTVPSAEPAPEADIKAQAEAESPAPATDITADTTATADTATADDATPVATATAPTESAPASTTDVLLDEDLDFSPEVLAKMSRAQLKRAKRKYKKLKDLKEKAADAKLGAAESTETAAAPKKEAAPSPKAESSEVIVSALAQANAQVVTTERQKQKRDDAELLSGIAEIEQAQPQVEATAPETVAAAAADTELSTESNTDAPNANDEVEAKAEAETEEVEAANTQVEEPAAEPTNEASPAEAADATTTETSETTAETAVVAPEGKADEASAAAETQTPVAEDSVPVTPVTVEAETASDAVSNAETEAELNNNSPELDSSVEASTSLAATSDTPSEADSTESQLTTAVERADIAEAEVTAEVPETIDTSSQTISAMSQTMEPQETDNSLDASLSLVLAASAEDKDIKTEQSEADSAKSAEEPVEEAKVEAVEPTEDAAAVASEEAVATETTADAADAEPVVASSQSTAEPTAEPTEELAPATAPEADTQAEEKVEASAAEEPTTSVPETQAEVKAEAEAEAETESEPAHNTAVPPVANAYIVAAQTSTQQELPNVEIHAQATAKMRTNVHAGQSLHERELAEHLMVVKAEYTHQSFEELNATINSDGSNNPLSYNALNIISPAYKSQTQDTAELVSQGQAVADHNLQEMQSEDKSGSATAVEPAASATVSPSEVESAATEATETAEATETTEAVTAEAQVSDTASTQDSDKPEKEELADNTANAVNAATDATSPSATEVTPTEDEAVATATDSAKSTASAEEDHSESKETTAPAVAVKNPDTEVIFATPKRFVEKPQEQHFTNNSDAHDAVKAMQDAVAGVVATSMTPDPESESDELLGDADLRDEDATLAYLQATTRSNHQNDAKSKNNNSLASLAAELIDDFDDPFSSSFSEELQGDEDEPVDTTPRIKRGGAGRS